MTTTATHRARGRSNGPSAGTTQTEPTPSIQSKTFDLPRTQSWLARVGAPDHRHPRRAGNPCPAGSDPGEDSALPLTALRHRSQTFTTRIAMAALATHATTYGYPAGTPSHHKTPMPPPICHQCPPQQGKVNPHNRALCAGGQPRGLGRAPR